MGRLMLSREFITFVGRRGIDVSELEGAGMRGRKGRLTFELELVHCPGSNVKGPASIAQVQQNKDGRQEGRRNEIEAA